MPPLVQRIHVFHSNFVSSHFLRLSELTIEASEQAIIGEAEMVDIRLALDDLGGIRGKLSIEEALQVPSHLYAAFSFSNLVWPQPNPNRDHVLHFLGRCYPPPSKY